MQRIPAIIVAVFVGLTMTQVAAGQVVTIKCESYSGRYQYCPANTDNRVKLTRQLSSKPCDFGRTWGYDRRGLWVAEGCRAEFAVGRDASSGGPGHGHGGHASYDDDYHRPPSAAERKSAYHADLRSKAARSNRPVHGGTIETVPGFLLPCTSSQDAPNWAVGTFRGYSRHLDENVTLHIRANGEAVAKTPRTSLSGYWLNGKLVIGNRGYLIERERGGIRATAVGDRSNIVHYSRIR